MALLQKQQIATASRARSAANRRASVIEAPVSREPLVQPDNAFTNPPSFKTYEGWSQDPNIADHHNNFTTSSHVFQTSNPYQMPQYSYSDPARESAYAMPPPSYVTPSYPVQLAQTVAPSYQQQALASAPVAYADPNVYGAGPQSWGQYIQALPNSLVPQEYHPASALLQLGGVQVTRDDGSGTTLGASVEGGGLAVSQAWPSWSLSYDNVH